MTSMARGADRRGAVNDLLRNVAQIDPQILQTILVAHRVENFVDADAAGWLEGLLQRPPPRRTVSFNHGKLASLFNL